MSDLFFSLYRGFASARRVAIVGAICAASLGGTAFAAPADLTIRKDSDLSFGSFIVINSGDVTVGPDGNVSYSNAFRVRELTGSPPAAASFTITGEPGADIEIAIPATPIPANLSGLTATFKDFQATPSVPPTMTLGNVYRVTLPATGSMTLAVGGKVDVARMSGSGTVGVNINVTAAYVN